MIANFGWDIYSQSSQVCCVSDQHQIPFHQICRCNICHLSFIKKYRATINLIYYIVAEFAALHIIYNLIYARISTFLLVGDSLAYLVFVALFQFVFSLLGYYISYILHINNHINHVLHCQRFSTVCFKTYI